MLIISQYPEMVQIPCYKRFSCNQLSQNLCFCIKNWNSFGHLIPVGGVKSCKSYPRSIFSGVLESFLYLKEVRAFLVCSINIVWGCHCNHHTFIFNCLNCISKFLEVLQTVRKKTKKPLDKIHHEPNLRNDPTFASIQCHSNSLSIYRSISSY
jgi:hypothetical protein